jgi:adenylate kinase family enzyme
MRIAVIGNSGSGKSTLARWLASARGTPHLDLDVVAWEPEEPGILKHEHKAVAEVEAFCASSANWVVEGC